MLLGLALYTRRICVPYQRITVCQVNVVQTKLITRAAPVIMEQPSLDLDFLDELLFHGSPPPVSVGVTSESSDDSTSRDGIGSSNRPRPRQQQQQSARLVARNRRSVETELVQNLAQALAPDGKLDKMATLSLAVRHLKLKRVLGSDGEPLSSNEVAGIEDALGGAFLLLVSYDGDILYASSNISQSLGYSSLQIMSRNIYNLVHHDDRTELQDLLAGQTSTPALIRLRYSKYMRSPMRAERYKVCHLRGRRLVGCFAWAVDPLPHPADNRFPMWYWVNENVFTTVLTMDMKFLGADASCGKIFGYQPDEYIGRPCFEFLYPDDLAEDICKCKTLYQKGQVETGVLRFLIKGGGYVVVCAQKTTLNSNAVISSRNRSIVVSRHFILGIERRGEIFSSLQLGKGETDSTLTSPTVQLQPEIPMTLTLTPPPSIEELTPETSDYSMPDIDMWQY